MKPMLIRIAVALTVSAMAFFRVFGGRFSQPADTIYNIVLLGLSVFLVVNGYGTLRSKQV